MQTKKSNSKSFANSITHLQPHRKLSRANVDIRIRTILRSAGWLLWRLGLIEKDVRCVECGPSEMTAGGKNATFAFVAMRHEMLLRSSDASFREFGKVVTKLSTRDKARKSTGTKLPLPTAGQGTVAPELEGVLAPAQQGGLNGAGGPPARPATYAF